MPLPHNSSTYGCNLIMMVKQTRRTSSSCVRRMCMAPATGSTSQCITIFCPGCIVIDQSCRTIHARSTSHATSIIFRLTDTVRCRARVTRIISSSVTIILNNFFSTSMQTQGCHAVENMEVNNHFLSSMRSAEILCGFSGSHQSPGCS